MASGRGRQITFGPDPAELPPDRTDDTERMRADPRWRATTEGVTTTVAGGTEAPPVRRVGSMSGMTCAACAARVENRLKLDGVRASVNFTPPGSPPSTPQCRCPPRLVGVVERAPLRAGYAPQLADRADPDDATARLTALVRLAVAAVLFVHCHHLSIDVRRPALHPVRRRGGFSPGWRLPDRHVGLWPFHRVALRNARHGVATPER